MDKMHMRHVRVKVQGGGTQLTIETSDGGSGSWEEDIDPIQQTSGLRWRWRGAVKIMQVVCQNPPWLDTLKL